MAIYHLQAQVISRGKGQSAIASAAYRSGEKLYDEQSEQSKYYKREVQPENHILAPANSPSWVKDRQQLWNEVERSETRKNSRLAREINVALPKELSNEQQTELIKGYVQEQFVDKGMVADIAIHRDNKENPHAHIMMTTREISEEGFTTKNRDWNKKENLEQWREQWAEHANKALEKENIQERITHKSHADRGLEVLPTIHLGHVAHAMEKKGMETDRGNINRDVQRHNAIVYDLQKYREEKQQREALLKEQEKKKEVGFTPAEQKIVKAAEHGIGEKPTLQNINENRKELQEWHDSNNRKHYDLQNKGRMIDNAVQAEAFVSNLEKKLEEKERSLENTGLFQRKEKEKLRTQITGLQSDLAYQKNNLATRLKEANLSSREELAFAKKQIGRDISHSSDTLQETRNMYREQKEILDGAEKALKAREIREVASQYPELRSSGKYLDYNTASKLKTLNEQAGKTIPIEEIKNKVEERKERIRTVETSIQKFDKSVQNAKTAEKLFKQLNEVEKRIDKIESNPLLKGKAMFHKESKQEYQTDLQKQNQLKAAIQSTGYKDQQHVEQHKEQLEKGMSGKEHAQKEIATNRSGNDFLSAILQGIERAKQQEQRVNAKEKQKQRSKSNRNDLGMER